LKAKIIGYVLEIGQIIKFQIGYVGKTIRCGITVGQDFEVPVWSGSGSQELSTLVKCRIKDKNLPLRNRGVNTKLNIEMTQFCAGKPPDLVKPGSAVIKRPFRNNLKAYTIKTYGY
jgi:hypothetical protein